MNEQPGFRRRGSGIAVSGRGEVAVEPTIVLVSVGVSWEAASLAEAKSTVADKATAARDHLLQAGVQSSDLQTAHLSVHTIRDHHRGPEPAGIAATRFHVSTTMRAIFRQNLGEAQLAVDGLFDTVGDGLELHGLQFDCDDRRPANIEARRLAFADAEAKAQQLATLSGVELGLVLSVREGGGGAGPAPRMARAMMADAAMPIEGGSLTEAVDVQVRWSIPAAD